MRVWKKVLLLTMALCLIMALSGITALAEKVHLTVATWDAAEGLVPIRTLFDKFEAENPGIEVEIQSMPQGYMDRVLTQIAAGNPPDTFMWYDFTPTGITALEPLDGKGINFDNIFSLLNIYNQSADGTMYGVAKDFTSRIIWYNTKLFDKAGVPYPNDNLTWPEFRALAKKVTNLTEKIYGFLVEPDTYGWVTWTWANGGDFLDPTGTTMDGYLNSPKTIETIEFLSGLYLIDKVSPSPAVSQAMGGGYEMMMSDKLAMMESGMWYIGYCKAMGINLTPYGTALNPYPEGGSPQTRPTVLHTCGWVMPKACKNKEETVKVLRFLANEGGRTMGEGGWGFPVNLEVAKDVGLLDDPVTKTFFDAMASYADAPPLLQVDKYSEKFDTYIMQAIEKIMLGQATVEEALNWAVKESEAAKAR